MPASLNVVHLKVTENAFKKVSDYGQTDIHGDSSMHPLTLFFYNHIMKQGLEFYRTHTHIIGKKVKTELRELGNKCFL